MSRATRRIGPGIVLAATGVGAGDLVAATDAGARYGMALVWAAALGAVLKFALSEGLARWQLATGTTLLEGWSERLGRWIEYVFLLYLIVWSFVVGGALISACGMAAHALVPAWSVATWGTVHSLVAAALVLIGGYARFERLIGVFVGLMFVTLVGCAAWVDSPVRSIGAIAGESGLPAGSTTHALAVIGGVGGSVTLLAYGYWMRECGWRGPEWLGVVRVDLAVGYVLTGLFGIAVMVLAARMLHTQGIAVEGRGAVLRMAEMIEPLLGAPGRWAFLVGFWGAVTSSILGVWQGVPYLFCDFVGLVRRLPPEEHKKLLRPRSLWYLLFLGWLSIPTLALLSFDKPVAIVRLYAVLGALFMPFLAATLIYMNRRVEWVGGLRSRPLAVVALLSCLVLFGFLGVVRLLGAF